jgi:glycosyltransferase
VITAVLNGAETIQDCIKSVSGQSYPNVEHIIIDGGSTDGTLEVMKRYAEKRVKIVSEPDNGIYDAMNKGIRMADGDIIGLLNADDLYADESVIQTVVDTLKENNIDACYGDLVYVDKNNTDKVIRYWKSPVFKKEKFGRNLGLVPAHPTFFVKGKIYEKYGLFDTNFRFSADHELMIRFLYRIGISAVYIPKVLVKMRIGGSTNRSLLNIVKANIECYRAWKANSLEINPLTFILMKPASKIRQYTVFKKLHKL